jgi:hypothetical protein
MTAATAAGGANRGEKGSDTPGTPLKDKKQLLLRLSPRLWQDLSAWAAADFRSLNGQIEYLLSECVKKRKKGENNS